MGFWDIFKPGNKGTEPEKPQEASSRPKGDFGEVLARQMGQESPPGGKRLPIQTREYTEAEKASYEQAKREQLGARIRERIVDHTEGLESSKRELSKWALMSDQDLRNHVIGLTLHNGTPDIETFRSQKVQRVAESMRDSERVLLSINLVAEALHATGNDPQAAIIEIDKQVADVVDALRECQRLGKPENVQQALWSKHARLRKAGEILRADYKGVWNLP